MKIILYICIWIVGIDPPMKVEIRTPFPDTFVRSSFKTDKMKTINLTQGKVTLVDDDDYDFLMQWKWHYSHGYAVRKDYRKKGSKGIFMHRVVMNTPDSMQVDHKDRHRLNNQKSNLRNCTIRQNSMNKTATGVSSYLGVSYLRGKYITAQIMVNRKRLHLGYFPSEELAAKSYDEAAKLYFGEFANLNFK